MQYFIIQDTAGFLSVQPTKHKTEEFAEGRYAAFSAE
jgi:phage terminase large subunit GpA-like protein